MSNTVGQFVDVVCLNDDVQMGVRFVQQVCDVKFDGYRVGMRGPFYGADNGSNLIWVEKVFWAQHYEIKHNLL